MKKLFVPLALLISAVCFANPVDVNEKVLKAFKATFTDVKKVSWMENGNVYYARFNCNGIDTQASYNKDGLLIKTIRYYGEKELTPFITSKIKERFKNKSIYGVTETRSGTEVYYYVVLEDAKSWLTLKADAFGNISIHDKMRKA